MRRSSKALLAVGVTAAAVGGGYAWYRWLMKRQATWQRILADNIPVHSAYWRARRELPGDVLYIAIGDSAAQGIGASRPARSYVGVIAKRLEKLSGRSIRVINLGISGATLSTALEKELPRFARLRPELVADAIVTVCIGANDIAGWDAARFSSQIDEVLSRLPAHAIVADLPSFYFLPGERTAVQANRMLRAAAARHGLRVVDLHETMKQEGMLGVATQFAGDLFHPNDRGYDVWANAFEAAVEDRLEQVLRAQSPADQESVSGSSDSSPRSQSRASTNTSSA
ncbi:SGNH/GDSL hydrolase family protein [Gryllotalpicola protaetiae]|uniref:SGNH/GDSL hydrolase family protein n=1 Tax=Gryllotalpicola protaetiae TaxID=2419771 RepID=A0A387BIU9_9MICO|nr:SGNH/GDSL hydrolase family protein [Gryllotalpicola protaetiae]AYG03743.1 SGNH/GDSL hydrolase family protein [Gryllotalpicola protaetiae]